MDAMEYEDGNESKGETNEVTEKSDNSDLVQLIRNYSSNLQKIGLNSAIDYTFFRFSQIKSQELFKNSESNKLNFLFNLCVGEYPDRKFPLVTWHEKIPNKQFFINNDPDGEVSKDLNYHVLWITYPSKEFETREILQPTDFHLYFLDVIKPKSIDERFSAEELYKEIDKKRGETYFITLNERTSSHNDGTIVMLFVTDKHIIVFNLPKPVFEGAYEDNGEISIWISQEERFKREIIYEKAIFALPEFGFVTPINELDNSSKNETDCEMCGS